MVSGAPSRTLLIPLLIAVNYCATAAPVTKTPVGDGLVVDEEEEDDGEVPIPTRIPTPVIITVTPFYPDKPKYASLGGSAVTAIAIGAIFAALGILITVLALVLGFIYAKRLDKGIDDQDNDECT